MSEMFGPLKRFLRDTFSSNQLVAVSKPGRATIQYSDTTESRVSIHLYMKGLKRSYKIYDRNMKISEQKFEAIEFWVATGKFPKDDQSELFEWIPSERELSKIILKRLVKD